MKVIRISVSVVAFFSAVSACAQTIGWTKETNPVPGYTNGGYENPTGAYDPVSGRNVLHVLKVFGSSTSYVHLVNGSPTVTRVSGDFFSAIWTWPDQISVAGYGFMKVASGTTPTSCTSGIPISCTVFTATTNFTGTTGNYTWTAASTSIYSDLFGFYQASTNSFIAGPGWGSLHRQCYTDSSIYNLPDARQAGNWATDTKRNRLYLGGGVNNGCQWDVTTNGTSTVTINLAQGLYFIPGSLYVGIQVAIPGNGSTYYTVASVPDEQHMTINCGGSYPACPNGPVTAFLAPSNMYPGGINQLTDMGYLSLNSDPTTDTWTQLPQSSVAGFSGPFYVTSMAYDTIDDAIVLFGEVGGHTSTYVMCSADGNVGGTLTSAQLAVGCVTSNVFVQVTTNTPPPGLYDPFVTYDHAFGVIWQTGGSSLITQATNQTDVWKYTPSTKTWAQMNTTNQPSQTSLVEFFPPVIFNSSSDCIVTHVPDVPQTKQWCPAISNAWVTLTASGSSIPTCSNPGGGNCGTSGIMTTYDPNTGNFLAVQQTLSVYPNMWQGQLPVPPTITSSSALTTAVQGSVYTWTFVGIGEMPITWSVSGGSLPAGLTLNSSSGILSGTPSVRGLFSFVVQAANGISPNATQNITLLIDPPITDLGIGHSTYNCLDVDGDGYGVGPGCLGPDADDNDATVHSYSDVITTYGSLATFWLHMGWALTGVLYVDGGSGSCASVSTPFTYSATTACATIDAAITAMTAGQAVVMRSVTQNRTTPVQLKAGTLSGSTCTAYSYYLAYPGEQPDFEYNSDSNGAGFSSGTQSCFVLDGMKFYQSCLANKTCSGGGYGMANSTTVYGMTYSHNDVGGFTDNIFIQYNQMGTQITHDYVHDSYAGGDFGHGIYLGSNVTTSSGTTIQGNIFLNAEQACIHANGPMTSILIDSNMIYGCNQGILFQSGVAHSTVQNNTLHTVATTPFELNTYANSYSTNPWQCHDENYNLIVNNTIFMDGQSYNTSIVTDEDSGHGDIEVIDDGTCQAQAGYTPDLGHNTYSNNLLVHYCGTNCVDYIGPIVRYGGTQDVTYRTSDTYSNNLLNNYDAATHIIDPLDNVVFQNCSWFENTANIPLASGTVCGSSPLFVAANPQWNTLPQNWNLAVYSTSPAVNAALASTAPAYDIVGNIRQSTPTIGAYDMSLNQSYTGASGFGFVFSGSAIH